MAVIKGQIDIVLHYPLLHHSVWHESEERLRDGAACIQTIPTFFLITKDGDIERQIGVLPYQELKRLAGGIME